MSYFAVVFSLLRFIVVGLERLRSSGSEDCSLYFEKQLSPHFDTMSLYLYFLLLI